MVDRDCLTVRSTQVWKQHCQLRILMHNATLVSNLLVLVDVLESTGSLCEAAASQRS